MSYQAQVWLCTMIVSRHRQVSSPVNISQICWPPKILRPLPWQPNFIQTLATGAISKWMTRTTEPISTYTPLNLVTLFWTWHYKHGRYAANFPVPWLVISKWCLQVVGNGWGEIYNKYLPVDGQMRTFYRSIKFIVVFHVNMLPQLHLP